MKARLVGGVMAAGLLALGLGTARPAVAEDEVTQPAEKLGRGIYNTAFGWTEVVTRPQAEAERYGAPGLVKGLLDGVAAGAMRTVTGATEAATFWSPVPVRYKPPITEPSSPLEKRY